MTRVVDRVNEPSQFGFKQIEYDMFVTEVMLEASERKKESSKV